MSAYCVETTRMPALPIELLIGLSAQASIGAVSTSVGFRGVREVDGASARMPFETLHAHVGPNRDCHHLLLQRKWQVESQADQHLRGPTIQPEALTEPTVTATYRRRANSERPGAPGLPGVVDAPDAPAGSGVGVALPVNFERISSKVTGPDDQLCMRRKTPKATTSRARNCFFIAPSLSNQLGADRLLRCIAGVNLRFRIETKWRIHNLAHGKHASHQ